MITILLAAFSIEIKVNLVFEFFKVLHGITFV